MTLLGQFKSSEGITLNGSNVSVWEDQSGNGNHVEQTIEINQPEYVTDTINGHSALRFNGLEFMECLNSSDLEIGTGDFTFAVVYRVDAGVTGRIGGKAISGGSTDQYIMYVDGGQNRMYSKVGDGNNRRATGSTSGMHDGINYDIAIASFNAATNTMNLYMNGSLDNDTSSDVGGTVGDITTVNKFQIGDTGNESTLRYQGDLFEIRIYSDIGNEAAIHTELNDLYSNPFVIENDPPIVTPPQQISIKMAVVDLLLNTDSVTTILSDRLFPAVAPKGTIKPYITYQETINKPRFGLGSQKIDEFSQMQLNVWSESMSDLEDLVFLIQNAMRRDAFSNNGVNISEITNISNHDLHNPPSNGKEKESHGKAINFEIYFN